MLVFFTFYKLINKFKVIYINKIWIYNKFKLLQSVIN